MANNERGKRLSDREFSEVIADVMSVIDFNSRLQMIWSGTMVALLAAHSVDKGGDFLTAICDFSKKATAEIWRNNCQKSSYPANLFGGDHMK